MPIDSEKLFGVWPSRFRWMLRFSLRTFFVLLTIGCFAGGWFLNRAERERAAVKSLEQLEEVTVTYEVCFVPAEEIPVLMRWHTNFEDLSGWGPHPVPEDSLRGQLSRILGMD